MINVKRGVLALSLVVSGAFAVPASAHSDAVQMCIDREVEQNDVGGCFRCADKCEKGDGLFCQRDVDNDCKAYFDIMTAVAVEEAELLFTPFAE